MEKHQGNTPYEHRKPCNKRRNLLLCSLVFIYLIPLYFSPSLYSRAGHCLKSSSGSRVYHKDPENWCPLPNVTFPGDDGLKASEHFMESREFQLAVERLSAVVRVPTESFDDNGDVDEDPRWATFQDLHQVLEQLFPLVHSQLELRKVNRYGLQYTFRGTDPSLKPILLTGHQDVVPSGTASRWTYPPFDGHFDGTFVWGRGAADCKSVVIGILSTIEDLLAQSFVPHRTIVLAFGFDEETGGLRGAASLNESLIQEWGSDSFLFILDEGGMGIQNQGGDIIYAYPSVGEKGYYDIQLTLEVNGGHSSRPPRHTGIGIMADAIVALERDPYTPRLTQSNPFRRVLECRTKYSPDNVQPWLRDELLSGNEKEIAEKIAAEGTDDQWLLQTSQAIDMITGGVKVNALPENIELQVNHRVALHDSTDYINKHIQKVLAPVAQKYGFQFEGFNTSVSDSSLDPASSSILRARSLQIIHPSPTAPTDNGVWEVFSGTIRHVFETTQSAQGKTVVPVGNIMTGNSDTVNYWDLTKNIYRFTPSRNGTRLNQHGIDERMGVTAHLEGMRLYYDLIRNFDSWKDE
ncbi:putative vacuolar carboxypeptidase Cps1 [Annulohypoxylon bovei var. microspora]|nr:putative vacuolar carboxypeptidase Cps1 [Annulohypoxylon bovei var. microspora]